MAEFGEGRSWEPGWGGAPSAGEIKTKPKPEHDADTEDTAPLNSNPADSVRSKRLGGVVTGPDRPRWD